MEYKIIPKLKNIFSIMTIIYFLLACYYIFFQLIDSKITYVLVYIIPFILSIILLYINSKAVKITLKIIIIIYMILSILGLFYLTIFDLTHEYTDIKLYNKILNIENYNKNFYQFPKNLNMFNGEKKILYTPGFLMCPKHLLLSINNDSRIENVDKYISRFEYVEEIDYKDEDYDEKLQENGILNCIFYDNNYNIYILESSPYKENDWNHGILKLIAVNSNYTEVIFETEIW